MGYKIGLVSLGCSKNLIDSEQMLWLLEHAGYDITPDAEEADVVVLNTCGFIDSAKAEAIESIIELGKLKQSGKLRKLIVAGCLAQRFREDIECELPEVDGLVGCGSFGEIVDAVRLSLEGDSVRLYGDISAPVADTPRIVSTPAYTAFIKIAEGCDNRCSYCVIPSLRGKYRSRSFESLIDEAKWLADGGVRELIVVAQDTTRYGTDLYGKRRLSELLTELCKIEGIEWVRLHYMYPDEIDDELIDVIASEPKITKYLDIPIQHISDKLLKSMNRRCTGDAIRELIVKLRQRIEGVVIRTSLIVGLPGETDAEFEELCKFLKEFQIERAGVFPYSAEEGTPAADMPGQVDEDTKYRRAEIVMGIQQKVQDKYNKRLKSKTIRVLVERYDEETGLCVGRSYAESPEIDGAVLFDSKQRLSPGDFVDVHVNGAIDGELRARHQ